MQAIDPRIRLRYFDPSPRSASGAVATERLKRALDVLLAAMLLAPAAPVIFALAAVTRATSPGPAIYCQRRVGLRGRCFVMYKIRTMVVESERDTGATWSRPGDPRVTPLGRFLRASHLDELPQLWNILKGDMSLVGPRPERPEFVHRLEASIPRYRERLAVRPGLTGLAQVTRPPDLDEEDVGRKLEIDLHYIRHAGFGLDFRILLCTWAFLLGVPFCTSRRVMRLPAFGDDGGRPPASPASWDELAATADGA